MSTLPELNTIFRLSFAVVAPFAVVWVLSQLGAIFADRRDFPDSISQFSDHFTVTPAEQPLVLPSFRPVWPSADTPSPGRLSDLLVMGDEVVVAARQSLYRIHRPSGATLEEVRVAAQLSPISDLSVADSPHTFSLYSFDNGAISVATLSDGISVRRPSLVAGALLQPHLVGGRIVANGAFPNELIHTYHIDDDGNRVQSGTGASPNQKAGKALFPKLRPNFSRQLNVTAMDVSRERHRLVVAFRWSDRIHLYDSTTLELERAVAGPQETRLSFGTADYDGELVFTLDAEATHAYAGIVAGPSAIVGLYSGIEMRRDRATMGLGTRLHVFDWDGRLIGDWGLPEPVQQIAIDWKRRLLYAIQSVPQSRLLQSDLSPIVDKIDSHLSRIATATSPTAAQMR
jgi:hypothetical protein